jgi:LuxR family maltose regulon positive regulatory protein
VVAPPGYGKTTLLSQWAEGAGAFAWVSVDDADNDPKVLLTYIAEALDAIEPIEPVAGVSRVVDAAPAVALALGYDIGAALEELDGP